MDYGEVAMKIVNCGTCVGCRNDAALSGAVAKIEAIFGPMLSRLAEERTHATEMC